MSRQEVRKGATVTSAQSSHEFWAVQNCRSSCFLWQLPAFAGQVLLRLLQPKLYAPVFMKFAC